MTEKQAREKLNEIAVASFRANIKNPDAMQMDNTHFVVSHINQIRSESRHGWNYRLANVYVARVEKLMRRA